MKVVRETVKEPRFDDHEAAAAYITRTYSDEEITAQARAFWLREYEDKEEFAHRLNDAVSDLDPLTALVALRIEDVWRKGGQGGSSGGDPHGAAQGDDPDIVRAVAEDTLWIANRLWDGSHAGVSRWAECASELARALGPLDTAVGRWRAEAAAGQREG